MSIQRVSYVPWAYSLVDSFAEYKPASSYHALTCANLCALSNSLKTKGVPRCRAQRCRSTPWRRSRPRASSVSSPGREPWGPSLRDPAALPRPIPTAALCLQGHLTHTPQAVFSSFWGYVSNTVLVVTQSF